MKISTELKRTYTPKRIVISILAIIFVYVLFVVWPVMATKEGNVFLLVIPAAIMIPCMLFFLWNLNKSLLHNEEMREIYKKEKRLQRLN